MSKITTKSLIHFSILAVLGMAPIAAMANYDTDAGVLVSGETSNDSIDADTILETDGDTWAAKHLGCVNSSSSCQKRAYSHGYSHSRIQQDYRCPKTIYSCYAW